MASVASLSRPTTPAAPTAAAEVVRHDDIRLSGTGTAPQTKTANYTLADTDRTIVFDPAGGALTGTLPSAVGRAGKRFTVKKKAGTTANPVTIACSGGELIDGLATETISVSGGFREVESDGVGWHIIGGKVEPVIVTLSNVANAGSISIDASVGSIYRVTTTGATATLPVPTNPIDGDSIFVDLLANVALSLTVNASIINCSGAGTPIAVGAGKRLFLNLRTVGTVWYLLAVGPQP